MKPEKSLNLANQIAAGQPWMNSLGVTFVPAGTDGVLFNIWDVRVKDYAIFVKETKRDWPKPSFDQIENDPAVNVTWHDATAFGEWLTKKERAEGKFSTYLGYRLPTLLEWSAAVGNAKYPWGETWPPPPGAGNYPGMLTRTAWLTAKPHLSVALTQINTGFMTWAATCGSGASLAKWVPTDGRGGARTTMMRPMRCTRIVLPTFLPIIPPNSLDFA